MPHLDDISGWITGNLPALLAAHKVPGAAVGVYVDGEVFDFASGVLSHATGVEATTDSVFQIGSITKAWTGTLVMQLADEGLLDIDRPVVTYLPDFGLADSSAARAMTVRQLLDHTAGFEGDIFTDTGNNDDCVEKYVATLAADPQLFAPGEMFSYNNAGYRVLGRVVEVLRGKPFDQALRDHLFAPLGLTHAATDASPAILYRRGNGMSMASASASCCYQTWGLPAAAPGRPPRARTNAPCRYLSFEIGAGQAAAAIALTADRCAHHRPPGDPLSRASKASTDISCCYLELGTRA
jgi:CubicO group peptidase (beta-lactamase class C family)